jgi:signal transduction histidine kinase
MDWAASPLGQPESWSQALRTAVHLVLGSRLPMLLFWGPELIQFYNDAFRPSLCDSGRHLQALGARAPAFWTDVWDTIGPQIDGAMRRGESTWFENQFIPVARSDRLENAWWTCSYSPVLDDDTSIGGCLVTCQETTARVLAEHRLIAMNRELEGDSERLEQVFRQAPAFLAVVRGADHVLERANDSFLDFVGRDGIVGRPLFDSVPEMKEQGYKGWLDHVLQTGEPFIGREVRALLHRTPGAPPEERFFDVTCVTMIDDDGTRSGVITHGTDVTEYVRGRRELQVTARLERQARAGAEAEARSRDEVLAIVSHDLRTPMAAITMAVRALLEGDESVSESARKLLELVRHSADSTARLIRDLLDVASIEAGGLKLKLRDEAAASIVARAADLFRVAAGDCGIALDTRVDGGLPAMRADGERLLQALANIVANALAFTPRGGRVTVCAEWDGTGVRFVVEDTGVGIAAEDLPHVFDHFWQRRRRPERQGTGLGLAIVRGIVEAHGGRVGVESTPGHGSQFSITIPILERRPRTDAA